MCVRRLPSVRGRRIAVELRRRRGRAVRSLTDLRRDRIALKLGRRWRSNPRRWRLRIRMRQRLELLGMSAF